VLFKTRFHDGIRSGAITETVRAWKRAQAVVGNDYKFGAAGRIRVDSLEVVKVSELSLDDATRSGFDSVEELVGMLRSQTERSLTRRSNVYRLRFHYRGERADSTPELSGDEIRARLTRMGAWSFELLREVSRHPGVSSAVLAHNLGRDRPKLKADMRKLKRLGLTRSLEVGYELTDVARELIS